MLSYQHDESGEWLGLAMQERLLLVKRQDAPESASRLWDALGTDNGAQAVLDELTSGGLFSAPSFALLTWDGELAADAPATLNVIVRGDITVQIDTTEGQESVTGRTISTWAEQALSHVTGFAVSTGAATKEAPSLPLGVGVVRAAQVTTAPITTAQSKAAPKKKAPTKTAPVKTDASVPLPQGASATETAANPAPPTAPVPESPAPVGEETIVSLEPEEPEESAEPAESVESDIGATVVRDSDRHAKSGASPEPNSAVENGPRIDLPTFITGSGPVPATPSAPTPAPTPAASPLPTAPDQTVPTPKRQTPTPPAHGGQTNASSGDHDGMTVMSGDIRKMRDSKKLRPGSESSSASETGASSPAAAPTMYLLLPSGTREPLTQPILVGRSPSVTKVSGGQVPRLVSLGGADQDISRNHVQFQIEGDTVVVTDLHSRNGTLIVLPGKPPQKLRQGEPTSVIVGTVVDLGSGISLTVCED